MKRTIILVICIIFILSSVSCYTPYTEEAGLGNGWKPINSMEIEYATQFSVDYYKDGYKLISLKDADRYLVIPEGKELPKGVHNDIKPVYQPVSNVYIAAASAMCHFDLLKRLDTIRLSGTKKDGWHLENVKAAMEEGNILYAGKYSQPDYELILDSSCSLAIESTMIYHKAEIIEKLESLGVSVFVDKSSFETHPLGRAEWIKLYAAMINREEKANEIFKNQVCLLNQIKNPEGEKETVAFFHITPSNSAVIRKSGDYITKMIELAGGKYAFKDFKDLGSKTATENIEMETFYKNAKDADIIIYNTTMYGEIENMEEFLSLNHLLKDFKAVKNNRVWCTKKNMFQETAKIGQIIEDFNKIITNNPPLSEDLNFFYKLQ